MLIREPSGRVASTIGLLYVIGRFIRSAIFTTNSSSSLDTLNSITDLRPLKILCSMNIGPTPSQDISSIYGSDRNGLRGPISILSRINKYSMARYSSSVRITLPSGVRGTWCFTLVSFIFFCAVKSVFKNVVNFVLRSCWLEALPLKLCVTHTFWQNNRYRSQHLLYNISPFLVGNRIVFKPIYQVNKFRLNFREKLVHTMEKRGFDGDVKVPNIIRIRKNMDKRSIIHRINDIGALHRAEVFF